MTHDSPHLWLQEAVDDWLADAPGKRASPQDLVARLGLAAERKRAEIDELRQCRIPLDQLELLRREDESLRSQLKLARPSPPEDLAAVPPGRRLAAVLRLLHRGLADIEPLREALALQSRIRRSLFEAKRRVDQDGTEEDLATLDALHAALLSDNLHSLLRCEAWSDYRSFMEACLAELEALAAAKPPDICSVFGLPADADADQIRRRYRELVRELHPDRNLQRSPQERRRREEEFKRIQAAWETHQKSNP